jgi:hypothetical protein
MLSIRQMASLIWAVTAFMFAAALVLNVRFKSLGEGSVYVDTWTGQLRSLSEEFVVARADDCSDRIVAIDRRREQLNELRVRVERIRRAAPLDTDCKGVCFAFPAR